LRTFLLGLPHEQNWWVPSVTPTDNPALVCEDLVHVYLTASGGVHALRGVTAEFRRGTVSVVIGPSGCGKSTLLRLLACMEPATAGELSVQGVPTARMNEVERRRLAGAQIGYVFQRPAQNMFDFLNVEEHITFAVQSAGRAKSDIAHFLELSELSSIGRQRPESLDAGERQRLAMAMAAASAESVVIADEPSAELDAPDTQKLASFIRRSADQGQTFIIASHDAQIMAIADVLLVMKEGCLAQIGPPGRLRYVVSATGGLYLDTEGQKLFPNGLATASIDSTGVKFVPG
jgi:putative ABC transport system ATP-binding protein